jgi:hypothetical protein
MEEPTIKYRYTISVAMQRILPDWIDNEIIWGTIVRHLPLLRVDIDNLMK